MRSASHAQRRRSSTRRSTACSRKPYDAAAQCDHKPPTLSPTRGPIHSAAQRSTALVQAVTMQSLLANNIMYNGNPSKPVAPNGAKAKVLSAFWATASEWHCSHCSCSLHCRWSVCRVVRSRRCAVQRERSRSAPPVAAQALSQPSQLWRLWQQRLAACNSVCRSGLRSERVVRTLAGPRAMINFNDGFGGGSEIVNNLVLNSCRESSGALFDRPACPGVRVYCHRSHRTHSSLRTHTVRSAAPCPSNRSRQLMCGSLGH